MNDIIIMVDKNAMAYKKNSFQKLGNKQQNLQNKLKFEFEDEIVEGQAWLEFEIDGVKKFTPMEQYEKGYQVDIKDSLLISDKVSVDLKITQNEEPEGVPVFITNIVTFDVEKTICAEEEKPDDYPSWFETANKIINEANNLNLDINKNDKVSTITINKKDGTQKSVDVYDGKDGTQGVDGLSATIQVGNVTTLEPGENATVTNVGTENNAIFNFGIPKGEDGAGGTGNVSSDTINSIVVVDYLPEVEEEGVLYLVKNETIIPDNSNLFSCSNVMISASGNEYSSPVNRSGITYTFTEGEPTIMFNGTPDSNTIQGFKQTTKLEQGKTYKLYVTNKQGEVTLGSQPYSFKIMLNDDYLGTTEYTKCYVDPVSEASNPSEGTFTPETTISEWFIRIQQRPSETVLTNYQFDIVVEEITT